MRRLALTLATAVLASGCIIGDDDDDDFVGAGSAIVYWDFVRNAPAQPGGAVLYDDATIPLTGTGACPQSAVEVVTIDVAGAPQQFVVDCVYLGVQGATLDGLPAGSPSARIRGWRGDFAVYDETVALSVIAGGETDQGIIDVPAVLAPIDMVAYFSDAPDQFWPTCNGAGNPSVDYEIWDSFPTLVAQGTVACGAGMSAFPLDVFISNLDLDNYTVRMKGFIGNVREYDSCTSEAAKFMAFDHFAAQQGEFGIPITLFEPPACTAQ